jgi:cytidylate kinase
MSSTRGIVVAIDGPAGAGKSSVSRRLTAALGYRLLDTGALYRAVALSAARAGVPYDDATRLASIASRLPIEFRLDGELNRVFLAGEDVSTAIRQPAISQGASVVSALPGVRAGLLDLQRRMGDEGAVVAEGRDIGTVVFPAAQAKFFLTASDEVRARRRYDELRAAGADVDLARTLAEMRERDARDSGREVAPLKAATDAIQVDSSAMGLEQVVDLMMRIVREREVAAG